METKDEIRNMMKEIRIIIAGGRDFDNYKMLRKESLSIIKKVVRELTGESKIDKDRVTIISGGAKGADSFGEQFANEFNLQLKQFPANWDRYGKRAGYMRNCEMAEFAADKDGDAYGVLIAFWDSQSKGTKHMIDTAKKIGIESHVIEYDK